MEKLVEATNPEILEQLIQMNTTLDSIVVLIGFILGAVAIAVITKN